MTNEQKTARALAKIRDLGALPETIYQFDPPRILIDRPINIHSALLCRIGGVERRAAIVADCQVEWVA